MIGAHTHVHVKIFPSLHPFFFFFFIWLGVPPAGQSKPFLCVRNGTGSQLRCGLGGLPFVRRVVGERIALWFGEKGSERFTPFCFSQISHATYSIPE
jgi:hypothetical protein